MATTWIVEARSLLANPGCSMKHYRVRGVSLVEAAGPDGGTLGVASPSRTAP